MKKRYFSFFLYVLLCWGCEDDLPPKWATTDYVISDDINGVVINGVRWATRNVSTPGTFAGKPEYAGMFYQWNCRVGWRATYQMINSNGGSTWDISPSAGTVWEKNNDPSPAGWRVPTINEIETLLDTDKVKNEWTKIGTINGRIFTDKASGKSIFLPAAGSRNSNNGTLGFVGSYGNYWYNTRYEGSDFACHLSFDSGNAGFACSISGSGNRNFGFSVRPVAE